MKKSGLIAIIAALVMSTGWAQSTQATLGGQMAGLREDVRIMTQRVGELMLRIEQLERENQALRRSTDGLDSFATVADLNSAVADLSQAIDSGDKKTQANALGAIQELAKQTNKSVASVAQGINAARTVTTPTFDNNFEKTGVTYTMQAGDTVSSVASRFDSTVKDIINANKIANPRTVQVGQTLFIPGGK